MPVQLIVNNIPFQYPVSGDEPGWGSDATGWAKEVTTVLSDLQGPNDVLETAFNIANNQTSLSNITGLILNSASLRAADITYSIYRISTSNPSGHTETGTITVIYDNAVGWSSSQGPTLGIGGVYFTLQGSGQMQYTSTDIGSSGYVGTLKFRVKALDQ